MLRLCIIAVAGATRTSPGRDNPISSRPILSGFILGEAASGTFPLPQRASLLAAGARVSRREMANGQGHPAPGGRIGG